MVIVYLVETYFKWHLFAGFISGIDTYNTYVWLNPAWFYFNEDQALKLLGVCSFLAIISFKSGIFHVKYL